MPEANKNVDIGTVGESTLEEIQLTLAITLSAKTENIVVTFRGGTTATFGSSVEEVTLKLNLNVEDIVPHPVPPPGGPGIPITVSIRSVALQKYLQGIAPTE